ncbi:L-carnitine dehydratase/bile acid-inducible protein F [Natrialba chahannaoensis JCM 10990]|uniref:L-carnitine dehydratase/bile acid-inducible protein F n=1 Tax=Natrialba chahannaoensis JCM 10990 TaxID=1227492 RepID=M0B537_9EURY|nr:CoA transferase [Natrialba chahannaoensis]ELZ04769.1 L-carnitine dehydratase/bile acid-inducible protein F [Natrialba chahannaoensis JCM 10990]
MTDQFPWYDVYPASEGYVTLAALEPHFWQAFCEAVNREEWIEYHMTSDPAELETLREALESLFKTRTRDEWVSFFEGVDAAVGGVYTPAGMVEYPQIEARGPSTLGQLVRANRRQSAFPLAGSTSTTMDRRRVPNTATIRNRSCRGSATRRVHLSSCAHRERFLSEGNGEVSPSAAVA